MSRPMGWLDAAALAWIIWASTSGITFLRLAQHPPAFDPRRSRVYDACMGVACVLIAGGSLRFWLWYVLGG